MSGVFAAHVTGNLILFASTVGHKLGEEDALRLVALPVFIGAEMAVTILFARGRGAARWMRALFGVESFLLLLVAATAMLLGGSPITSNASIGRYDGALTLLLVTTMATQNAAHRLYPKLGAYTTIMTGNITQLSTSLAMLALPSQVAKQLSVGSAAPDVWPAAALVLSFIAGCLCAAPIVQAAGFASIVVPAITVLGAAYGINHAFAEDDEDLKKG